MSSPHESPVDGGVSVAPEAPYLSVVVTARNNHHGGNLLGRMQVFVDAWIDQAKRHNVSSELIVVAWNPPVQCATVTEWTDRMRRSYAPMIFTLRDWGLADRTLPETAVQAEA